MNEKKIDKLDDADNTPLNRYATKINRPAQKKTSNGQNVIQEVHSEKKTFNSLLRLKTIACASHAVIHRLMTIRTNLTNKMIESLEANDSGPYADSLLQIAHKLIKR